MKSPLQQAERNIVSEQAAKWLSLLPEADAAERANFVGWLKQSPRNVEEFLFAATTWQTFAENNARDPRDVERIVAEALAAKDSGNVVPWVRDGAEAAEFCVPRAKGESASVMLAGHRREPGATRWAAGVLAAIGLATAAWIYRAEIAAVVTPGLYATDVGEQRTIRLSDGSVVYLNARSQIEVDFTNEARNLKLSEGEAVFKVAPEAGRPFLVRTTDALVQAIGTEFNVYRRTEGTVVSVLEGRVRVSSDPATQGNVARSGPARSVDASLGAGEEASVGLGGALQRRVQPDVAASVAWRQRRLVFKADRLQDIAAEFSRYSPRRIELKDEVARNTLITGTFDADDPDSLLQFLAEINDIAVERDGENFVVSGR